MSGLATRVVLHREYHVFGDPRFERLAGVSASHIDNLRCSRTYRTRRTVVEGTKATAVTVGEHRGPQPHGLPRLPARRHRSPGRARRRQGRVSDQPCRRGDAVRVHRCRRGDLRALPGAGARRVARPVPVRRCRLPRRQWLRVHQPHRDRATQQAARARFHQVAPAPLHRQRPGREQERQCRSPVPWPRPHPAALHPPDRCRGSCIIAGPPRARPDPESR